MGQLKDWVGQDWVRIGTDGSILGSCGTSKDKKNPDRCLPRAKAESLSKSERAATAQKKKSEGSKGKTVVSNTKAARVSASTGGSMIKNKSKADLNKDGKLSSYEKKRGAAIEKNLNESFNPEVTKALNRFIKAMAKRYSYSEQDAVYAIMAALKQRDFDGVNESKLKLKEGKGTTLTLSQSDMDKLHKDGKLDIDGHSIIYKTTMEERVDKIDGILEEEKLNHDLKVKATQIIKNTLKKEGGASGLKPLVDAVKGLGISKNELSELLKKMVKVEKHTEGDYILTPINE